MAGLTHDRATTRYADRDWLYLPVAKGAVIRAGTLVAVGADGFARPAAKADGLTAAGGALECADNSNGNDGTICVNVQRGGWLWDNTTGDNAVTQANILQECYILDDHTVTMLAEGSSAAGKVLGIDGDQVIVETY